ncbi:MAG: amylo-alpha-1,6-glucosidase [bacterium]
MPKRKSHYSAILFVILMTTSIASLQANEYTAAYLDSMSIAIPAGKARPYLYSGIGDAFFYSTTGKDVNDGHMGFYWREFKLWNDFYLYSNGERLNRAAAVVEYKPDGISFCWESGIVLEIIPIYREFTYLQVRLRGAPPHSRITFLLHLCQPASQKSCIRELYAVNQSQAGADTLWTGIASQDRFEILLLPDQADPAVRSQIQQCGLPDEIMALTFAAGDVNLYVLYAASFKALEQTWNGLSTQPRQGVEDRRTWLLEELNRSSFRCQNDEYNLALNWAKINLASLWFERETALWAGLPWFNDCWGRDTFISLPGACLVLGKFEAAKKLLRRFAHWQCRAVSSSDYGRIPNRVRAQDVSYNTADGTPWFVKAAYEYGLYSGDHHLWQEFLADGGAVRIANDGTLSYHTDKQGFLVHEDAATWMDAVGPDGAWTPRGNRAVEIQALWLTQLELSIRMMQALPELYRSKSRLEKWHDTAALLRQNVPAKFVRPDGLGLYDHLNADDAPDSMIRPNQLFALTVPLTPIFSPDVEKAIIRTVSDHLVYPYGVASLAQTDPEFHPYHQHQLYPRDAAYHMGVVWTWLSGPYKSVTKSGWIIAQQEMDQILRRGAPGTLPELFDAVPRKNELFPRASGTVSQTWSLAEFIRTWYQDYIGLKPYQEPRMSNYWLLQPSLPRDWGDFSVLLHLQRNRITLKFHADQDSVHFSFTLEETPYLPISVNLFSVTGGVTVSFLRKGEQVYSFPREGDLIFYTSPDGKRTHYQLFQPVERAKNYLKPQIAAGLKALQPPAHVLLMGREVTARNAKAKLVIDAEDPPDDDVGDGGFTYPTDPHFQAGILDVTRLQVRADEQRYYFTLNFRKLVQPGWHPEYGFQLTFATIAIKTGASAKKTRRQVGCNANWQLPADYAADRFIHVSGPLLVEDGSGKTLCEYIPTDPQFAIGNVLQKSVSFAIPRSILPGDPSKWRLTVLVGAQDDHGGAGLGEFRAVAAQAGRWVGGGGGVGKGNVYDWLVVP